MSEYQEQLDWLAEQDQAMRDLLVNWCDVNSGTGHHAGLNVMCQKLQEAFGALGGEMEVVQFEGYDVVGDDGEMTRAHVGEGIRVRVRPDAKFKVFLCIHMDTVYGVDHSFQKCEMIEEGVLRGPGVADAKGGLMVMLYAIKAFERSGMAKHIGLEILINPDEEIGSPCSTGLIHEIARGCDVGMLFEPSLPNGDLVKARKGSGNFQVVLRGKAAHAGRAYHEGCNAIYALGGLLNELDKLNNLETGVTVNVGEVVGGGAVNIVPDLVVLRFNVRVKTVGQMDEILEKLECLVDEVDGREGYTCALYGQFFSPPKDGEMASEFQYLIEEAGDELDVDFAWQSTGGVCDGNKMAAVGLPNVDTLGPVGGAIHSDQEYVNLNSLVERAKLSALILMKLADGAVPWATI